MINTKATEHFIAHLHNHDAMRDLPAMVRSAERLGCEVDIRIIKDGMGKIHSLQVMVLRPEDREK
jgi:hypothetical protein